MTFDQFASKHGVQLDYEGGQIVRGIERCPWPHYHFDCTLSYEDRAMKMPYRKGLAFSRWRSDAPMAVTAGRDPRRQIGESGDMRLLHDLYSEPEPPYAAEVLETLALDAWGARLSYHEWCFETGSPDADPDSMKLYLRIQDQAGELMRTLGIHLYNELLVCEAS